MNMNILCSVFTDIIISCSSTDDDDDRNYQQAFCFEEMDHNAKQHHDRDQ